MRKAKPRSRFAIRGWRIRIPSRRWRLFLLVVIGVPALIASFAAAYYYAQFSRIIEARLHGERDRVIPRVFARPLTLRAGQGISLSELVGRLNDIGYTEKSRVEKAGEFTVEPWSVVVLPRGGDRAGQRVTIAFPQPRPAKAAAKPVLTGPARVATVHVGREAVDVVTLDAPMLTALMTGSREKRRRVPLSTIPARMQQAVLAIEDRRFYSHLGLDPISIVGAVWTNATSDRRVGRSTITQQLSRMFFLSEEFNAELQSGTRGRSLSSYRRKALEMFMAVILETKATKEEVLELYLNDVYLGNRGSFAIHGVPEAARMYFGKDVTNVTLAEAALIAGAIQNPSLHSPFSNAEAIKRAAQHRAPRHGGCRVHHRRRRRARHPRARRRARARRG